MKSLQPLCLLALLLTMVACGEPSAPAAPRADAPSPDSHSENAAGEADEHQREARPDRIELSADQIRRLGLQTARVQGGRANNLIRVPASLTFNQDRVSRVGPLVPGRVREVVADLGDRVEKGDPLVILTSPELGDAKARYLGKRAEWRALAADWRRVRRLAEQDIVSQAERMDTEARYRVGEAEYQAAAAVLRALGLSDKAVEAVDGEKDLTRYVLTSPQDGVVERRDLVPGQRLTGNETPILIADTGSLWIFGQVDEKNIASVRENQRVRFRTGGVRVDGRLDWVASHLDETSRSLRVRATVDNPPATLKAGQYGRLTLFTEAADPLPLVPIDAVQTLAGKPHVFVPADGEGAYRAQAVTTGKESDRWIEITRGLAIGDTIVTVGAFDLKSALTAGGRSADHGH